MLGIFLYFSSFFNYESDSFCFSFCCQLKNWGLCYMWATLFISFCHINYSPHTCPGHVKVAKFNLPDPCFGLLFELTGEWWRPFPNQNCLWCWNTSVDLLLPCYNSKPGVITEGIRGYLASNICHVNCFPLFSSSRKSSMASRINLWSW